MSLDNTQKHQLNKLIDYRDEIETALFHIERILKNHFPSEHSMAYQHWIPQITTALKESDKWLPRGQYTLQNTIDHISDNDNGSGVNKYI
jgi:flagellar biosynthesis chaperone FliJ